MKKATKRPHFDYAAYRESDVWRALRRWKLDAADHRCQVCNGEHELNVHHRTYERIGEEREADLIVLCRDCHKLHHGIEDAPDIEIPRPALAIIANPARWGQYANRVAEINRELRIATDGIRQTALLNELADIRNRRAEELK